MSFANKMNGVATKLLKKFDERTDKLTLVKRGEKVWNPATGEYDFLPDTNYILTGVQRNDLSGMIDGTTIRAGDMMITASTEIRDENGDIVDYEPTVNDKMVIDGAQWSIVDTPHSNYSGADKTIVYKIQVRK